METIMAAKLKVVPQATTPQETPLQQKLAKMATDYRLAIETANDNLNVGLSDLVYLYEYTEQMVWDAIEAMDDSTNVGAHEIVGSLTEAAECAFDFASIDDILDL
jgi:hypothetical protein